MNALRTCLAAAVTPLPSSLSPELCTVSGYVERSDGLLYRAVPGAKSHRKARAACKQDQARLAVIKTSQQLDIFKQHYGKSEMKL